MSDFHFTSVYIPFFVYCPRVVNNSLISLGKCLDWGMNSTVITHQYPSDLVSMAYLSRVSSLIHIMVSLYCNCLVLT